MRAGSPASDPSGVAEQAASSASLAELSDRVIACRACPRLVEWRERAASEPRPAYAGQTYWARPVPGFGVERPEIMIVGLAPSAHGANRTGRMFTGDRSGDWLFAALFRVGLATQQSSVSRDDGLQLRRTRIASSVRCAPPANKPSPTERHTCRIWLTREIELVWPRVRSIVVLGGFGWQSLWPALGDELNRLGRTTRFGHGVAVDLPGDRRVFGCFHPSPLNTSTGRLTAEMLDSVLIMARDWADGHQNPR